MSSDVAEPDGGVVGRYRSRLAVTARGQQPPTDELTGPAGIREHQNAVVDALDALGLHGLRSAQAEARRFVRDDGVRYGSATAKRRTGSARPVRRWEIDPIPVLIPAAEWSTLEAGLQQRALLLDKVLADLYGEQRLLREGVIPPEVVYGHPGFVHQAVGTGGTPQGRLVLTAADLGRGADGSWQVIADRDETPAGAGYAMASRRITTRVMAALHRGSDIVRLRGFFHTMTLALQDVSVTGATRPRIVLLSPGADSDTAFEQSFIATLCGFPVVEAEDLVMRDGRVWIETSDRPEPVDVILRRVDAALSDPLELRADSEVGVPGLIEAVRRGQVTVANPIGAGLLDNPGLLPYLPRAARHLLDEDLLLPSPQTWWCGDPAARGHVLAHLDSLIVKPIAADGPGESRFGWRLSATQREELRRAIELRPWAWCGQAALPLSTAPVVTPSGLEPRRLVLRTFTVTARGTAHVLPGGLGRVAPRDGDSYVSTAAGALAKDVWVVAADGADGLVPQPIPIDAAQRTAYRTTPSPRVASSLYRVGRQAERVEGTARLLRVTADLVEDHGTRPGTPGAAAMAALLGAVTSITGTGIGSGPDERAATEDSLTLLRRLLVDVETPGSVSYAAARLVRAAQEVRDQLSGDAWIVLSRLERTLGETPGDDVQLQPQLAHVLESGLAIAGIVVESMVRDAAWGFIDAGTRIERAQHTLALLGRTLATPRSPVTDGQVTEAVLSAGESIITHRRRMVTGEGPASPIQSAVTLLLVDPGNPRSVAFCFARLAEDLRLVGDETLATRAEALLDSIRALDIDELCAGDRSGLAETLSRFFDDTHGLGLAITKAHFTRRAPQHTLRTQWATATETVG